VCVPFCIDSPKVAVVAEALFGREHWAIWIRTHLLLQMCVQGCYGRKARTVSLSRLKYLLNQLMASPQAAAAQDILSIVRTHALAETMNSLMPTVVGLIGALHVFKRSPCFYVEIL
jgi:hypothetical protein